MILGSVPCTLATVLIWHVTLAIEQGRAAGQDVGFDVIGVVMMAYYAFLLALGTCITGLLYFGYAVLKKRVALQAWHSLGILYSVLQVMIAVVYMSSDR